MKYFGGSGGLTYTFPWPEKPWQLNFSGGLFYETTTAKGDYGFINLYGPEAGLSLKYSFRGGHHIRLFGKYSAVMGNSPTFDFKNLRKLQIGAALGFVMGGRSVLTVSLDQTQHTLEFAEASIRNKTLGFGVSFGL